MADARLRAAPDPDAIRATFDRAAAEFDSDPFLGIRAADEVIERLALLRMTPQVIVDLGAGTGRLGTRLLETYPESTVFAVDASDAMLAQVPKHGRSWFRRRTQRLVPTCATLDALPFDDASVDLAVSNLALHCCDPETVMAEARRILRPGGAVMFSTFGPDTLTELDAAWRAIGQPDRVLPFMDMHDLGDVMLGAGLADPVVDMEMVTLTYTTAPKLWADLRRMGSRNVRLDRPRGLMGRARMQALNEAISANRDEDGLIRISVELVYGHGWAPLSRSSDDDRKNGLEVVFQG